MNEPRHPRAATTKAAATAAYHIRPYTPADARGVRAVIEAAYGESADPEAVYNWWSGGCGVGATGYMVAEVDGQVVGAQPMELFPYLDGPQELLGAVFTGVAVHPGFRRLGIFTALVRACEAEAWRRGAAFVTTMPNERSRPGFIKMGYQDLGRRHLLMRLLRPAALGGAFVPALGQVMGGMAGLGQRLIVRARGTQGISVGEVKAPSEGWAALFQSTAARGGGPWIRRSSEWLRWRYVGMPLRSYRFFEAHDANSGLVAAAVTTQERRSRLQLAYVMELAAKDDAAAGALLAVVYRALEGDGVHAVAAVVSSPAAVRTLHFAGLARVPSWAPVKRFYSVARFNPDRASPDRWKSIEGWQQTLGDWDSL